MQRKSNKRNGHLVTVQKEKTKQQVGPIQDLKKNMDCSPDLSVATGYICLEPLPAVPVCSKVKTILCQIFCFWK